MLHWRAYSLRMVMAALALSTASGGAGSAQDNPAAPNLLATNRNGTPPATPALPTGVAKEELYGTAVRLSKWKRNPIEVCWLSMPDGEKPLRDIVKRAVSETWERNSSVRFSGWLACTGSPIGIRIHVADEADAPHVKWIGRFTDGRDPGMVLNFTFMNWRPECRQSIQSRDSCIYAIAVHEFGHALGFTHEQNRPDAPDWCRERKEGAEGDYNVTKYDPRSIMNYCNAHWLGDGQLSELDVEAVQAIYGST